MAPAYEIHRWHDETHFYKKIIINDPLLMHAIDYHRKSFQIFFW